MSESGHALWKRRPLLYRHAWYQHFKFLAQYRIPKDVNIRVICGRMGTKEQAKEVRAAIDAVCQTGLVGRSLGIVSWETATAWATAGRGLCVLVPLPCLR
jgi:hypothetical protein